MNQIQEKANMKRLIVSKYGKSLLEFLRDYGYVGKHEDVEIITTVESLSDVVNRDVICCVQLPLNWLKKVNSITQVYFKLPREYYGKELSLNDRKKYFSGIETYGVNVIVPKKFKPEVVTA